MAGASTGRTAAQAHPADVEAPAGRVSGFVQWLGSVDAEALSDAERVELVAALERVKGGAGAAQARATDALRRSRERSAPRDAARSVGSEVALARRESPTLGDRFVGLARALVHEMPDAMAALTRGEIVERHVVELARGDSDALRARTAPEVDRRLAAGAVGGLHPATGGACGPPGRRRARRRLGRAPAWRPRWRRDGCRCGRRPMAWRTSPCSARCARWSARYAAVRARARAVVGGAGTRLRRPGPRGRGGHRRHGAAAHGGTARRAGAAARGPPRHDRPGPPGHR